MDQKRRLRTYDFLIHGARIKIDVDDTTGQGRIHTTLATPEDNATWHVVAQAIEAILLDHAINSCDPDSPEYLAGLNMTIGRMSEKYRKNRS